MELIALISALLSECVALRAETAALRQELSECKAELAVYKQKYADSQEAYGQLLHDYKQLQRQHFGSTSERYIETGKNDADTTSDNQSVENSDTEPATGPDTSDEIDDESTNVIFIAGYKRRKKKDTDAFKTLPRREIIVPAENKICTCGKEKRCIRYETTELLNYRPAVYEILVQKREVLVCTAGCDGSLQTAPNPKRLLPKAHVTEEFLGHMVVSKLYDRQPLYHLEKTFEQRFDFICDRAKLARWFIESAKALQPLINLCRDNLLDYDVTVCDPTYLQVIDEPGREASQKSYVFCMRGGSPDKQVVIFDYNAENHKSYLANAFEGYEGYLQVDGQNIFEEFNENEKIKLSLCNGHARRKFEPIAKASEKPGLAAHAMSHYQALYKIEREAKEKQMTPEQRWQLRQEKSKPLIDKFETWLEEMKLKVLPQSPLGKAFEYVHKRTQGLRLFLEDGRLEIDTNLVEQKNKDFALARNNFMFSYSVEGAKALSVYMSLISTALTHGYDPYLYCLYVMQRVPYCKTVEDYEALLPWNVTIIEMRKNMRKIA